MGRLGAAEVAELLNRISDEQLDQFWADLVPKVAQYKLDRKPFTVKLPEIITSFDGWGILVGTGNDCYIPSPIYHTFFGYFENYLQSGSCRNERNASRNNHEPVELSIGPYIRQVLPRLIECAQNE